MSTSGETIARVRVAGYVSRELKQELAAWAQRNGTTMSAAVAVALTAGMKANREGEQK